MSMTDAQQSEYRDNIRSNIRRAISTINESGATEVEKALSRAQVEAQLATATGMVIIAERIAEQTEHMAGNEMALKILGGRLSETRHMLENLIDLIVEGDATEEDLKERATAYKDALEQVEIEQQAAFLRA